MTYLQIARPIVTVATDGSCWPNPGPGGWAWAATNGTWAAGSFARGTNNVGELLGISEALLAHPHVPLHIIFDSKYAHMCVTKWGHTWIREGQTDRANYALIAATIRHLGQRDPSTAAVTWQWVHGHTGHPLNERVDMLAGRMKDLSCDSRHDSDHEGLMAPISE